MIEVTPERIEAPAPEFLIVREPHRGLPHRFGQQFHLDHPAFFLALHQPRLLEHPQVFHEAGQRHSVRLRKFRHAGRAMLQALVRVRLT